MTLHGVGRPVESKYNKEVFMELIGTIAQFLVFGAGLVAAYFISLAVN